jgi:hypothetical protein
MNLQWNRILLVLVALALLPGVARGANAKTSPLDGTWRWEFTMPDSGVIKPTLKIKTEDDGDLIGTARFRAGSSTPVKNLKLQGDQVSFEVVRERDGEKHVTRYAGTLQGNKIKGKVISNWTGQEESYDWEALRFYDVEGTWKWRFSFGTNAPGTQGGSGGRRGGGGGGRGEANLNLKREEGEKLSGKLNTGRGDQNIKHGLFKEGDVSFQVERERSNGEKSTNYYWGKFSGDTIAGKFTSDFSGTVRTNEWKAARAD